MRILALVPAVGALSLFANRRAQKSKNAPFPHTFASNVDACCDCFFHKNKWPGNAGQEATVAPKKVCDTCYVHDRYAIDKQGADTMTVTFTSKSAAFEGVQLGSSRPLGRGGNGCDEGACEWRAKDMGNDYRTSGRPGGCDSLLNNPVFVSDYTNMKTVAPCEDYIFNTYLCAKSCVEAASSGGLGYSQETAKVEEVHEFHWNCEEGVLDQKCANGDSNCRMDLTAWNSGPVNGEPKGGRGPYQLCDDKAKWYCENKKGGKDMSFDGSRTSSVREIDTSDEGSSADPNNRNSEVMMHLLPVLDNAIMTAGL